MSGPGKPPPFDGPFNAVLKNVYWRDQRDLMERPFFSLSMQRRTKPINYRSGEAEVHVTGDPMHGIATIWDADILIWITSQIVAALERGLVPSAHLHIIPYQLLRDLGRETGNREYLLFRRSLNRLRTTTVTTNIRCAEASSYEQFSWIGDWRECFTRSNRREGIEIVLPQWFYRGACDRSAVLALAPDYFGLTGGVERWLYRIARKHAGRQPHGWRFSFRQLHHKSGSPIRASDFAIMIREQVGRQRLPEYLLSIEHEGGREFLRILPRLTRSVHKL